MNRNNNLGNLIDQYFGYRINIINRDAIQQVKDRLNDVITHIPQNFNQTNEWLFKENEHNIKQLLDHIESEGIPIFQRDNFTDNQVRNILSQIIIIFINRSILYNIVKGSTNLNHEKSEYMKYFHQMSNSQVLDGISEINVIQDGGYKEELFIHLNITDIYKYQKYKSKYIALKYK